MSDRIIDICIELGGFLVLSYLLFYKSWLKSMGKEIAKLSTIEDLTRIEQSVKKEFNEKLESLRAKLEKDNISYQVQFSYLHQKRSEITITLYQKLQEMHVAMLDWTSPLQTVIKDADEEERQRAQRVNVAITDFRSFFFQNKIYFSKTFCSEIENLFTEYWDKGWDFGSAKSYITGMSLSKEDFKEFSTELSRISKEFREEMPKKLNEIESKFRKLLAVEELDTPLNIDN